MQFLIRKFLRRATAALAGSLFAVTSLWAGEFTVSPIRLELGANVRSGVIAVKNEGKHKLSFQLQAMEWTQDSAGKDQYAATTDLIFFPKLMTIEPGDEAIVRVGARTPIVRTEKTYRLFIEELPGPVGKAPEGKSVQLNVLLRFGAPIFVVPPQTDDKAEILSLDLAKGTVSLSIRNTGNRHHIIEGIHLKGRDAQGKELYSLTLADRYLLAGVTKSYTTVIPVEKCAALVGLDIELKTDKLSLQRKLDVTSAMCP
jgi:fimbrial chaperone protein